METEPAWNSNYTIFTGLINNASYLSTYNATYETCVNNASYLSTYNLTYATLLNQNCASGKVVNGTYSNGTFICVTPTVTETEPAWNGNYSIFTGLINNASYLSTSNSTYDTCVNNASYLSTYNNTYATLLNQVCASGKVVNGTYSNGTFICVTPSLAESDPAWQGNYSIFTGLINNASYLSTFNTTYATTTIEWDGNKSALLGCINNASYLSTYNATYHNYVVANYSNVSNYWDNLSTYNSTQMDSTGGYLNIIVSWLTSLFYTESEIDSKIINNQSYFSTYNQTYAENLVNHTNITYYTYNTSWSSTYNTTYHNYVTLNSTNYSYWWNNLFGLTNNWLFNNGSGYLSFNDTKLNTTISQEGIRLGFNSTYNSTYAEYNSTGLIINHTKQTYDTYNAGWSATGNSSYRLNSNGTFTSNVNLTGNNMTDVSFFSIKSIGNVPCVMSNGTFCRNSSGLYYQSGV